MGRAQGEGEAAWRRPARRLALLSALLLPAGCGGGEPDAEAEVAPDSLLAGALVALHLADARAARPGEDADSLRAAAYALARRETGLDSAAVADRLADATRRPEQAEALYRLVADSLEALDRRRSNDD